MKTTAPPHNHLAWLRAWVWACLLLGVNLLQAQPATPLPTPAGQVTLVIGQAQIQRGNATASPANKGAAIEPGDTIQTSNNGHVHIRFVDGALVSVRPNSIFRIQEFHYDPAQPSQSTVRFSLETGEVRSISGNAAQAARERFRLNTPLVAIGVKGTDFLTQTNGLATRVTVNQGAIVMAPLDTTCLVSGLGACAGPRARELRADMGALTLVYQRGAADPGLQTSPSGSDGAKLQQLDRQFNSIKASAPALALPNDPLTPDAAASRMVWGRWANTAVPGDTLTVPFLQALQGNEVTVGDGYYFLFRQPDTPNVLPGLARQIDFNLQAASAYYRTPANTITTASVLGGALGINFANQTYSTSLTLATQGIDNHAFSMTGSVDTVNGIFLGGTGSRDAASLAGALALDANQAGYSFKAPAGGGSFIGATQWGRVK
jgi:hypothetical protein